MAMSSKLRVFRPMLSFLVLNSGLVFADTAEINADAIAGRWTTDRGSIVQFEKSGELYSGVIIAVAKPTPEQREEIDREDPENFDKVQPDFDTPDMIGVLVLRGLEFRGKGVWKGKFYNDRRHKDLKAKVTLDDRDTMRIRINAFIEEKQLVLWTRRTE
jgi:uncharacterized protein (DUF2147 family)